MGIERRRFKRLPTALIASIRMRKPTQTEVLQIQIRNVSSGGVFIVTPFPFPISSLVEFDFNLPGQKEIVHVKGVVRWTQTQGPDTGMGIEFLEVTAESREVIQDYVKRRDEEENPALPPGT